MLASSAYKELSTSRSFASRSSIDKINNNGDSMLPCGDPFSRSWASDVSVPTLTFILRPVRNCSTNAKQFPVMPNDCSLDSNFSCHSMSNALVKSRKTARVTCLVFNPRPMWSDNRRIWSIVLRPFLKPDWMLASFDLLSMK